MRASLMRHIGMLLGIAALTACAAPTPGTRVGVAPAAVPVTQVALSAPDGRVVDLTISTPARPRGVILFSHGGGSNPGATPGLVGALVADGFAVIAPHHTDSMSLPPERRTTLQAAFPNRVADQQLAAGYAAERFAGLPIGAVGYSYGALTALSGAGAFAPMIPALPGGPRAVVMLSSPGPIPPLTGAPDAFVKVAVPVLLVTGTADTVPGFVIDPAAHLVYFDRLPTGRHAAMIVNGGTHAFAGGNEPGFETVLSALRAFLAAEVLGDAAARARFAALSSSPQVTVRRR